MPDNDDQVATVEDVIAVNLNVEELANGVGELASAVYEIVKTLAKLEAQVNELRGHWTGLET